MDMYEITASLSEPLFRGDAALGCITAVCAATDLCCGKVFNMVTVPGLVLGIVFRAEHNGAAGILEVLCAAGFTVLVLFPFYILYAFQNVFDCTFYGRGKTNYMLFESVVTNTVYYGTFFVLYLTGAWTPSLIGIALMFGFGNAFDSVVSAFAYAYFLKKYKYSILCVK